MNHQPDSPNASTAGIAYACGRCGRHGYHATCTAPGRFEGNCFTCGQYGHTSSFCAIKQGYGFVRPIRVNFNFTAYGASKTDGDGREDVVAVSTGPVSGLIPQKQYSDGEGPGSDRGGDIATSAAAAVAIWSMDLWIQVAEGPTGDGVLHAGWARVPTLAEILVLAATAEQSWAVTPELQPPVELEVDVGSNSSGGDDDDDDWNSGVVRQQQLLWRRGWVMEAIDPSGGVSGGEGGDGGGPNTRMSSQLYTRFIGARVHVCASNGNGLHARGRL